MGNRWLVAVVGGLILVAILAVGVRSLAGKAEEKRLLHVLWIVEGEDHRPRAALLVSVESGKGYVHCFRIELDAVIRKWWGGKERLDEKSTGNFLRTMSRLLGVEIPYFAVLPAGAAQEALGVLGGGAQFNQHATNRVKGETLVTADQWDAYWAGIPEAGFLRDEAAFALWMQAFRFFLTDMGRFSSDTELLRVAWSWISRTNLPEPLFRSTLRRLMEKKGRLFLSQQRMNTEKPEPSAPERVPLAGGRYDREKLKKALDAVEKDEASLRLYPLTLQILNATSHGSLGATTAGTLRIRKVEVTDYRNLNFRIPHSILLDRTGSWVKREFITRVTKVDRVFMDADYRSTSDFTLILGEDFHGIAAVTNREASR